MNCFHPPPPFPPSNYRFARAPTPQWRVNVQDPDQPLKGLYFRSSPGVVVADADWPRNGDVVVGAAVSTGWIRLQNGYYLPTSSEDGRIPYLEKLANGTKTTTTNDGMDRAGFPSPQMSPSPKFPETQMEDLNLKGEKRTSNSILYNYYYHH